MRPTRFMNFMEVNYMQTIEDNNALWDALCEQIDRIHSLEWDLKELKEQLENLRH